MDNPTGTIHSVVADVLGTRAIVDVDVGSACPRCAAGKGCGAGLLIGSGQVRRVEAAVSANMALLAAGDRVELVLASSKLLRATLIVYGLPLVGAVGSAAMAYLLELGDAAAALAAIAGLSVGLLAGRWRLHRDTCLAHFVPRIEKRLPPQQTGA